MKLLLLFHAAGLMPRHFKMVQHISKVSKRLKNHELVCVSLY